MKVLKKSEVVRLKQVYIKLLRTLFFFANIEFATKVIIFILIIILLQVEHLLWEKQILASVRFPFVVDLCVFIIIIII